MYWTNDLKQSPKTPELETYEVAATELVNELFDKFAPENVQKIILLIRKETSGRLLSMEKETLCFAENKKKEAEFYGMLAKDL